MYATQSLKSSRHLRRVFSTMTTNKLTSSDFKWKKIEMDHDPKELRSKWQKPSFKVDKMKELLDHDNHVMRDEMRKFLSDPIFKPKYNISLSEEREVCSYLVSFLNLLVFFHN